MEEIATRKKKIRTAKIVKNFKEEGTFQSLHKAEEWIKSNGYSHGSLARSMPVAIVKGEYDLPQKWYNISKSCQNKVDGVMLSNDFREGEVTVIIYE